MHGGVISIPIDFGMRIVDCGFKTHCLPDIPICNLYPVESSAEGPPAAAFHRAVLKSEIDFTPRTELSRTYDIHWIEYR